MNRGQQQLSDKQNEIVSIFGYSNDVNPFGDAQLSEEFVWKKKEKKEKSSSPLKKRSRTDEEKIQEIARVKERRIQRDLDQKQWEEAKERIARERERVTHDDLEKKEEAFHLNQAKLRSEIRIREGRAKPIDLISKNLKLLERLEGKNGNVSHPLDRRMGSNDNDDLDVEIREPYAVMEGLPVTELEELRKDINLYLELDVERADFWKATRIVCDDEIQRATLREQEQQRRGYRQTFIQEGIQDVLHDEVDNQFAGKSRQELEEMEKEIQSIIDRPDPEGMVDVEFMESTLGRLQVFKAKALLREIHAKVLQKRLQELQASNSALFSKQNHESSPPVQPVDHDQQVSKHPSNGVMSEEEMLQLVQYDYESGDEDFNDLVAVPEAYAATTYKQNDKYRPRKPKYFNRVHTGFEWNKYNRTHYDVDNPPPKVIQGYKFNIFYPDLLDKTQTPTYFIEPGETQDTCYIRFHAGPPYEDIAFKIVNREWEKTCRRGYKCTFERGILHLYFRFKKYRYRR